MINDSELKELIYNADIKEQLFEHVRQHGKIRLPRGCDSKEEIEQYFDEIHKLYTRKNKENNDLAVYAILQSDLSIIAREMIVDYVKSHTTIPAHRYQDTMDRIYDSLHIVTPDDVIAKIPWSEWKNCLLNCRTISKIDR